MAGLGGDGASSAASSWTKLYHQIEAAPCFRVPLMWGIACGCLAGLHKLRLHRQVSRAATMNACDFAVLGMGVSTTAGWWMCEKERRKEVANVQRLLKLQGMKPMADLPAADQK